MTLQFILDNKGKTTGVFIPINEWENLKKTVKKITKQDIEVDIPEWQKTELKNRIKHFRKHPKQVELLSKALDDLEKGNLN